MARATTSTRSKTAGTKKTTTKTTRKAAPKAPVAPKTAKPATKVAPVVVQESTLVVSAPDLKKVDLVDMVVERSGIKKKFAKPAIEAALAVLGEALAEGRSLNLRPLGKVKVLKSKEVSNGTVITTRVRQPLETAGAAATAPKDDAQGPADTSD
ncbi:HU family DNA-binding protein [uncultured Shimia sp.]|uniref:HU family DNA-binding protein n=1 Tax=uncultured Shimia sp. TaxID=573152 RepID=UPI002633606A|nr:HU family DNA-binding protein [uncultured Shimia sp.]